MLKRRLYYLVKPYIPWGVRMGLRRRLAASKRRFVADSWPILASAGTAPAGWKGWPGGKRFAFVLTHDVERSKGLGRCRALMELEKRVGFRSSFNFVPEGDYKVSPELRGVLGANGFEVGVHDLHHDGHLYDSREGFLAQARRINQYLKEWNAVGFRSGFMHHNLDWIGDLDLAYDASTFDTDPFEPQPDAAETIFPFRVEGRRGRPGYWELPYTLAQDSTVYLLFEEQTIDVWARKLDWVAERGGMALLNTHPDYMAFEGKAAADEYPVRYYQEFMQYVRDKYRGLYWHALPRELVEHLSPSKCHEATIKS